MHYSSAVKMITSKDCRECPEKTGHREQEKAGGVMSCQSEQQ